jgi:uncharacterized membrane protein
MLHLQLVFLLSGFLFIVLGWPLARRRVPPNRLYGLRVPATFADIRVWYDANALAGRDMMGLGVATVLLAILLPLSMRLAESMYAGVCGVFIGIGALIMTFRGWRRANRMLRARNASSGVEAST